jgi:hypothetical protein
MLGVSALVQHLQEQNQRERQPSHVDSGATFMGIIQTDWPSAELLKPGNTCRDGFRGLHLAHPGAGPESRATIPVPRLLRNHPDFASE